MNLVMAYSILAVVAILLVVSIVMLLAVLGVITLPVRIGNWLGIKSRRQSGVPLAALPALPQCPAWTALERDWWLAVMNHENGRKLLARLRATEYALAVANAKDTFHTSHSAGVSAGYGQAIKHLLSLTSCCQKSADDPNDKDRTETDLQHDEYLARVSP